MVYASRKFQVDNQIYNRSEVTLGMPQYILHRQLIQRMVTSLPAKCGSGNPAVRLPTNANCVGVCTASGCNDLPECPASEHSIFTTTKLNPFDALHAFHSSTIQTVNLMQHKPPAILQQRYK